MRERTARKRWYNSSRAITVNIRETSNENNEQIL
jgi:hypothetical protein